MVASLPVARVALPIPIHELFDYSIPDTLLDRVAPGVRVRVPMGRSMRIGTCIERAASSPHGDLKPIDAVVDDQPILDPDLLEFARWTANYYFASVGEVIECAVPRGARAKAKTVPWVRLLDAEAEDRGAGRENRARLVALLREHGRLPLEELVARANTTRAPVKTLEKRGVVELFDAPELNRIDESLFDNDEPVREFSLSAAQHGAVDRIVEAIRGDRFESFLLHGVTGSGKTEVYMHAIEAALAKDRGALMLLPEIALTPQTVRRFRARFGDVAVLHSLLPAGERSKQYRKLRDRSARVAIGARSAIFAPIPDLGLIVVDECHETSYKQENSPRYHARDLAVVRASRGNVPCVLGSATPSMESLHNARSGRFHYLELPDRVTGHPLPTIELVDLRKEPFETEGPASVFSDRLLALLHETINDGDQALLFLNRRGFARQVYCSRCAYSVECAACDIPLTYHKHSDRGLCHYCGTIERIPDKCPECDFPGITRRRHGTERIEESLAARFPNVAIDRLDRDTATSAGRLEAILDRFRRGETRILVGTQMIAKGHDIPGVTLVGVLDADIALQQPDFRAAERTGQLLCQVAGRAGRGERPGRVVIQTRQPDHYAIQAALTQDLSGIYEEETPTRQLLAYPPFGHLIRIVCEDARDDRAISSAHELARRLTVDATTRVLGPAPAPLAKLRGRYRYHILIKGAERAGVQAALRSTNVLKPQWSTTRVTVDVDPQSIS